MVMLRRVCKACLLLACASVCPGAWAAEAPPTVSKLPLSQAVKLALEYNGSLKRSRESFLTAQANLRIAEVLTTFEAGASGMLDKPAFDKSKVSFQGGGTYTISTLSGSSASVQAVPIGTGNESASIGVTARKPLRKGSGILSRTSDAVRMAQYSLETNRAGLFVTEQSLVLEVINAYYNALRSQKEIKVREDAVSIAEQTTQFSKRRLEEELAAEIEVSRAENRLAQTRDELVRQRQRHSDAVDRLILLLGLAVGQTPELVSEIPDSVATVSSVDESIGNALKNRAELRALGYQIEDQQREVGYAGDQLRSSLDLVGSYFSSSQDAEFGASFFDRPSWTVGAEYTIPLDKRTLREERNTARRQLTLLGETLRVERERIKDEVRAAHRALEAAKSSLGILDRNLKVTEQSLYLAQRMVAEGLVPNREILEAQQALTETQSGILSARTDYYLAWVELKWSLGEDLTKVIAG